MTSFDRAEQANDRERAEACPYCRQSPGRCTCAQLTCPHCCESVSEDAGVEGPDGNIWHQQCLDGWREE